MKKYTTPVVEIEESQLASNLLVQGSLDVNSFKEGETYTIGAGDDDVDVKANSSVWDED